MANSTHNQALLSEQLLLLHELDFDYSGHRESHNDIEREMKLLDTIALLLSTGLPREHFAAAFDKRQGLEVVLAKSGSPNSEDTAAARELFSHLCDPEIRRARDLYPFVARRCRASVVKRIRKLRASIMDTGFYDDFYSRLDQCSSARDPLSPSMIKLEFWHDADSLIEDYTGESLSVVLRGHLDATIGATAISDVPDLERFMAVYILSSTLARSLFLYQWVRMEDAGYQKVQRFQRCTEKLRRYIDDVHSLVKGAKRLGGSIKYRWVTDESLGIQVGEEDIHIHAATPAEAAHRASVISPQLLEELKGPAHNVRAGIWWQTRFRYKPDPTWAFTARARPSTQGFDLMVFDDKVVSGVCRWLQLRYASVPELRRQVYRILSLSDDSSSKVRAGGKLKGRLQPPTGRIAEEPNKNVLRAMANLNHDQAFLSEQLLLLHELDLNYSDHTVSNDNVDREMKLLDTVAFLLSTGSPGDHFAAAFDKHQGLEVVLAKNGTPTSDDIATAKELFSHLCNPEIRRAKDLYPFVARRCRASVVKRFQKLRASIIDTGFYDDFCSRLDQCSSARDPLSPSAIKWEFWRIRGSLESYTGESLSVVLRNHLKATARATAVSEVPDLERFMGVYVVASTLAHSSFLEKWVELEDAGYQKVQRFQRCTEKLCRYIDDVHSLVKGAKWLGGPIKHRWVTDESLGIQVGEQDIRIHAETPLEAFHRASTLSSQQLEELRKRKPSITAPWQQTVHTCIHAELRIILHVGRVSMAEAHNVRGDIRWRTRARYKPDETWALTARACSNVSDLDLGLFDEKAVYGVSRWLQLRYASVLEFRRELYGIYINYRLRAQKLYKFKELIVPAQQ
ncbi:hypothetical protein AGABI1DRAFT_108646 [Agaricus bisporus var. burnettii JB137-S8]|uniref:Uncharacterized protein n=1 Tax=Agaricus bisporus var. burnettii (strain JB137-S8 / ATCC MYA-4627 / FGSC 10392) TaxID=597362 RepID=K5XPC7_AGABU|nr:uncharacterized protein AGABI1DRAFT_108646 [Agaricus bisporus var. burnettii JB137-S8]EKM76550.1 hypothetical protein AGABI1DRAFT_108646 [Agaricus bisporus var. burnettii JB137-S8]